VAVAVIGGLMLLLNAIRVTVDVPVRWFSVILGSAMLAAGGGALTGVHMDFLALIFVIAGVVTIGGALLRPTRATAG
jgi:fumarate reductase subunit C